MPKYYKIPYKYINSKLKNSEREILLLLKTYNITFICLAGYMKIISNKIVNGLKKKLLTYIPHYCQNLKA